MINKLPRWVIPSGSLYDTESATAIEAIGKLQAKMTELIEDYNNFVDGVNQVIEDFVNTSNSEKEVFETALRQEFQDFIDTVDIKIKAIETEAIEPEPVSIDLCNFDTTGEIVETFADGTSKTTVAEFDENGNPIKITDCDGNATTLIW